MHKAAGKSIVYAPASTPYPTASRTRSKQTGSKPALSTQSISSGSPDTSAPVMTLAVGSGQQFAKGTRQLSLSISCLCLVLCCLIVMLLWTAPVVLIVEFKTPTIKPLMMSSRDLFAKRVRDDKSTETESSKAAVLFSPSSSPSRKKVKVGTSIGVVASGSSAAEIVNGYNPDDKPSAFAHLLRDMLLAQTVEAHSQKDLGEILDDSSGFAFHVSAHDTSCFPVIIFLFLMFI